MKQDSDTMTNDHPIVAKAMEIENAGLMVFNHVNALPLYDESYISPFLTIGLNLQGWAKAEYDMQPVSFELHQISVVMPRHILRARETSPDYHAVVIVMTEEFVSRLRNRAPLIVQELQTYHSLPHFQLSDLQAETVVRLSNSLYALTQQDIPSKSLLLLQLTEVLLTLLSDYRRANGIEKPAFSAQQLLFTNFYNNIIAHFHESREVTFYASLANLSPKHFSTIIQRQTGTTAGGWINQYVITQAKSLLAYHPDLPVLSISRRLGFKDQATFSRFFKNNTGLSPREFRDSSAGQISCCMQA